MQRHCRHILGQGLKLTVFSAFFTLQTRDRVTMLHIMCHLLPLFARLAAELPVGGVPLRLGSVITVHGFTSVTICATHVQKRVHNFLSSGNMNKDVQTLQQASWSNLFFLGLTSMRVAQFLSSCMRIGDTS